MTFVELDQEIATIKYIGYFITIKF
jgi:hypothetical protein